MSKMRLLEKRGCDNRGSITVEMCMVMPIVIAVVMMLIMLLVRGANEGTALGISQLKVYQCSDNQGKSNQELEQSVVLDKLEGKLVVEKNEIYAVAEGRSDDSNISAQTCRRERDRCSDRLRRWQLYGDTIWE